MEGVGTYVRRGLRHNDVDDSGQIHSTIFLSFSSTAEATRKFNTDHYFVLNSPDRLLEQVRQGLPPCITEVSWKQIEYTKTMHVTEDLSPSDDWNRKFFCKPESYSDEKEWRLFIRFRHSFRILNETLKIHVGNLQSTLRLMEYED